MMYKTSKFIVEELQESLGIQKENSNLVDEKCLVTYVYLNDSKFDRKYVRDIAEQYSNENIKVTVNFPKKIMSEGKLSDTKELIVLELVKLS